MGIKIRWRADKGCWYLFANYKRKRYSRAFGTSLAEVESIKADVEAIVRVEGARGLADFFARDEAPRQITVKDYADQWKKELDSSDLRLSTRMSYKCQLEQHVIPEFSERRLSDVTYTMVKAWILSKATIDPARRPRRYSKDSCRLMMATGRAMFQEAVHEGLIAANPFTGLAKFYRKSERDDPDPFTREEWALVDAQIGKKCPEYSTLVHFLIGTGVRIGEALGLKWGDIDERRGEVRIRRTLPIHRQMEKPKTKAGKRTLELTPELMAELKAHGVTRKAAVFAGYAKACDWVFATPGGEPIDYSRFHKRWDLAQSAAKVRHRRPHDLRHTWASWALSEGKPLLWVSKQLGHSSPMVTLKIYATWMPGEPGAEKKGTTTNELSNL